MTDARSLSHRLADLLRREHHALADFLVALAEFDRDRAWQALGYTSCFYYLHRELGLSKSAAFYRASAAELVQRYPEVVEPLRDGRFCLSSVSELAKVITPENRHDVVARFFHASKQEAKAVVAELRPVESPPRRDAVTVVPPPAPQRRVAGVAAPTASPGPALLIDVKNSVRPEEPATAVTAPAQAGPGPSRTEPDQVEPLTADLRRLHVTVSKRFLAKLAAARDALSHSHPDATTEDVLEAALDLLLARKAKQKGLVAKPREAPPRASERARHIPAAVKRAVWLRDGAKCQWQLASGAMCGSTRRLELDHLVPVARGGASTVDNLRVLCASHNRLAAREHFGGPWMDGFARRTAAEPPERPPRDACDAG